KAKEAKKKEDVKILQAQALSPPRYRQLNIWSVYIKENTTAKKNSGPVSQFIKQLADDFKDLSSREREHYNHLVNEHNAKSLREFQEWLNAHTPTQIKEANAVRSRLRKLLAVKKSKYAPIKDDRLVKRPSSSFFQYHKERFNSGDFRGVTTMDASKDIAAEYRALSASEKKKYEDLSAKDLERYLKEHLEVYGFEKPANKVVKKNTLTEAEAGVAPSA
ncbi:hypothetical protein E4T44_12828, partial [Aureobasidium sp. EXF-8845]